VPIDHTHDPDRRSWIETANDPTGDFPIQNLPFGVFSRVGDDDAPRPGIAIGDRILDLKAAEQTGLLGALAPEVRCALHAESLGDLMRQGTTAARAVRHAVFELLDAETATLRDDEETAGAVLVDARAARMHLPATIGDYTDFYASIFHATNIGSMFRPDNPLLPNYRHVPIGYHGRASSIVPGGTAVRRPHGQLLDGETPTFGPCRLLDYELEVGVFIGGPGNALGERIEIDRAMDAIFGVVLVNDWSARDVQKWEYQPLGPFNAKNFATTVGHWIVTTDALAPFMVPGPLRRDGDPEPLPYLKPSGDTAIDLTLEVTLASATMRGQGHEPLRVSHGGFRDMYWTFPQMVAHHTSTGCNLRPGDLMASGTVSGEAEDSRGCLLERTWRGERPLDLPDGTQRTMLQDGDEVVMRGWCGTEGRARIGFGPCAGTVLPAQ